MKIGAVSRPGRTRLRIRDVAKHAEDLGFESYWVADHTIIPSIRASCIQARAPTGRFPTISGNFRIR